MSELLILPNGPLGRIAMRPLNIDPPDFKAAVRRWRSLRNKHPLWLLDEWLWEQQKNRYRAWWYSLSRREQDNLKGMRAETGKRIISHFKGPKYQRGMLSGLGVKRANFEPPADALGLSASNNSATNTEVSPGGPLDAGFGLMRNGQHRRTNDGGTAQINDSSDWINNKGVDVGDDFEVIWNQLTGGAINDESYAEDAWATLDVSAGRGRYVGMSTAAAAAVKTFEIDIGDVGTSTSDINQDYSIEAGDLL